MKFTIEKTSLLKALERAKSVTDNKGPMPILSHVRLEADPDKLHGCLKVEATNLFIAVKTVVNCSVDEDGGICLNAKDLYDRLKLMPDGDVKFTTDGTKATIKAVKGTRKFLLHGLPVGEYPTLPEHRAETESVTFNDRELADKIDSTIYAVGTDETRPFLNALLFEENNGKLNLASTDGHRLAVLRSHDSSGSQWLVPLNAVKELSKLCRESAGNKAMDSEVRFFPEANNLFVLVNGFEFSCKLADGQFPPYRQIIPTKWDYEIRLDRDKLVNTLKALVVSTGDSKGVKLSFGEGKLLFDAESINGSGNDEMECDYQGSATNYGVNALYMIQAVEQVNTNNVVLRLGGDLDPILIVEDNKKEGQDEYIAIVMPMRVG